MRQTNHHTAHHNFAEKPAKPRSPIVRIASLALVVVMVIVAASLALNPQSLKASIPREAVAAMSESNTVMLDDACCEHEGSSLVS